MTEPRIVEVTRWTCDGPQLTLEQAAQMRRMWAQKYFGRWWRFYLMLGRLPPLHWAFWTVRGWFR